MAGGPKYTMFQALRPHINNIVKFFVLDIDNLTSFNKLMFYNLLRVCSWVLVLIYNMQFLICIIQSRHNIAAMVDSLFLFLSTLISIVKQITFNVKLPQIKRLFSITEGELFSPKHHDHVEILDQNEKDMARLIYYYNRLALSTCMLQAICPITNRLLGYDIELNSYFPFDISKSPIYEMAAIYLGGMLATQAYVNLLFDCTIAAFYAQTMVQLRLLRYNLEHLVDVEDKINEIQQHTIVHDEMNLLYVDDDKMKRKVVQCVNHYGQIKWFIKEVGSISCETLTCQFLMTSWVICITVYKIVGVKLFSTEFYTVASYLSCMLCQLFIYSYYGTQLEVESQFICQSAYIGDWLALSPAMRRQLLIFMISTSRSITPLAAKIVPISLKSYLTVLKTSYSLFTILDKK